MRTLRFASLALLLLSAATAWAQPPAIPAPVMEVPLVGSGPLSPAEGPDVCPVEAGPSLPRLSVDVTYLFWWIKNGPLPGPMITLGSPTDPRPGAIGEPGTVPLKGTSSLDYMEHSGGLLTLDYWLDDARRIGVEAVGLIVETHTIHKWADSDGAGSPVIARPFFDTLTDAQVARQITAPGRGLGGIDMFSDSRLWGGEGNVLFGVYRGCSAQVDLLAGFRYLGMDESLRFSQSTTLFRTGALGFFGAPVPAPDIVSITDRFETRNEFFGGQLGARGEVRWNRWLLDLSGKAGIGSTHQWVNIEGGTSRTGPDGKIYPGQGGLLALAGNLGLSGRQQFSFVSEVGAGIGYQLCHWASVRVGYDFLYWDGVARPGDQINLNVNPRLIPSNPQYGTTAVAPQPSRLIRSTDFWAQGLTLSLALRF